MRFVVSYRNWRRDRPRRLTPIKYYALLRITNEQRDALEKERTNDWTGTLAGWAEVRIEFEMHKKCISHLISPSRKDAEDAQPTRLKRWDEFDRSSSVRQEIVNWSRMHSKSNFLWTRAEITCCRQCPCVIITHCCELLDPDNGQ